MLRSSVSWGQKSEGEERGVTTEKERAYEVERAARHAERPGFRISELQIGPSQAVPWHYHSEVRDTFYVLEGRIVLGLRVPEERIELGPGETYTVAVRRPHRVTNAGEGSAVFLVLQGLGQYDFVLVS
jgi:mannose-6-phosphate isomerase-like protein (cupin superfamily)